MIAYFDTSALVKYYVEEDGSEVVRQAISGATPSTSRLTEVEITSALARRYREGDLGESARDAILSQVRDDLDAFNLVEVTADVVSTARNLLVRRALRSNDAIQLASCLVLQKQITSRVLFLAFDHRLTDAARSEGLETSYGPASAP